MSNFNKHFKKDNILEKTKNSVGNLINYNDNFQNNIQYPGEQIDEMKIRQLLLPVYDKIYEIKSDLLLFSELNAKNTSERISPKRLNEIQHLHTNILYNKNIIDETLTYMKEKIENVNYEQINKEFEEIELTLENLKQEMEDMVEEFNSKYDKILKEKKRQKIANELLKGDYNKNPNTNKYGFDIKLQNNLDNDFDNEDINYNKYKYDINEIELEKDNLMLKYLEDKQKAINGLPKLVPPNQKVNFNYNDIKVPNYKNLNNNQNKINNYLNTQNTNNINNNIKTSNINNNESNIIGKSDDNIINEINSNKNNINNINEISKNINDSNFNNINTNSNNYNNIELNNKISNINDSNQINNNNYINNQKSENINSNYIEESKSNNNIPNNYYMNSAYNNEENNNNKNNNIDPTETLNNFKEKMSLASKTILTGPTPKKKVDSKQKKKIDPRKEAYNSYMRNIQPRSNASKITYQNFPKQKKQKQKIPKTGFVKKPNNYKIGKYPDENEKNNINSFVEKNPSRPINPNLKIIEQQNLEEEIRRIVDINIKNALNAHHLNKNNIESSQIRSNSGGNSDELLKILIQKFDDIENAIRETKNNNNGVEFQQDINEILANEIFNKIYAQMNTKILNIPKKVEKSEEEEEEEEEEEKEEKKEIKIQPKKEEIDNNVDDNIQKINIFNDDINVNFNYLDQAIQPPKDLNLNKYNDISITSEALSESMNKKPDINMNINNQIEIKNINIKKNQFLNQYNDKNINYNNKINQNENSLSEGEVLTNPQDSSDFDINQNNKYKTANNFMPNYDNKNRTGNDLLILKNYNENLPNINSNLNNINYNNNIDNNEEININNNKMLEKLNMFDSSEYNGFKNQFLKNMNNNKTLTNFESMNNQFNQHNLNDDFQNLKIIKHDEKEMEEINRKIELLKLKNQENNIENNNNVNNYINNNYINNNLNKFNNINNNIDTNEEGNSSPGEVRSDDSY